MNSITKAIRSFKMEICITSFSFLEIERFYGWVFGANQLHLSPRLNLVASNSTNAMLVDHAPLTEFKNT
jgi:hypothetical protein